MAVADHRQEAHVSELSCEPLRAAERRRRVIGRCDLEHGRCRLRRRERPGEGVLVVNRPERVVDLDVARVPPEVVEHSPRVVARGEEGLDVTRVLLLDCPDREVAVAAGVERAVEVVPPRERFG